MEHSGQPNARSKMGVVNGRTDHPVEADGTDFLLEVATRFYLQSQTQARIARELGIDPSTISRAIRKARDHGIVRFEIHRPQCVHVDLGRRLSDKFGLRRAIVVPQVDGPAYAVVRAAADYVSKLLGNGTRIALSWGRLLARVIHALPPATVSGLDISLLHGGVWTAAPPIQGHELARHLATIYPESQIHFMPAPVLVDSPQLRLAMLRDRSLREALRAAADSQLALVGIGNLYPDAPLLSHGHLSSIDRLRLLDAGAVGDFSCHFFNSAGQSVPAVEDRLIALSWEELGRIPMVVAIAAGREKHEAIWGALHSGVLDALVTDELTATLMLERASGES